MKGEGRGRRERKGDAGIGKQGGERRRKKKGEEWKEGGREREIMNK